MCRLGTVAWNLNQWWKVCHCSGQPPWPLAAGLPISHPVACLSALASRFFKPAVEVAWVIAVWIRKLQGLSFTCYHWPCGLLIQWTGLTDIASWQDHRASARLASWQRSSHLVLTRWACKSSGSCLKNNCFLTGNNKCAHRVRLAFRPSALTVLCLLVDWNGEGKTCSLTEVKSLSVALLWPCTCLMPEGCLSGQLALSLAVSWSRAATTWKYIVSSVIIFLRLNCTLACANHTFSWAAQNVGNFMATESTDIWITSGSPMWLQWFYVTNTIFLTTKQQSHTKHAVFW